jgi:hypothetical protein
LKTQIITLESHDDLISVRDRMSWAKTPRILLVWPKYEDVSLRVLDLKVLHRHADSLGAQLGLVTRKSKVRRDAESLGIPVFESSSEAQKERWPESAPRSRHEQKSPRRDLRRLRDMLHPKEAAWRTSLIGRILAFSFGVIAVLTVAGLFVPRAAVTLYPESQAQSVEIPVTASASISTVSLTGSVPAQTISATVSGEQTVAVTSPISVPKAKAKGVARFTNLSQSEVTIPAGTVVIAPGDAAVRFVTMQETRLPAESGQFVDTPIEAVLPGAIGNVDAEMISIVEGSLGLSLSVTNPEPTAGGTDLKTTGASEADRARLRNVVLDDLRQEAATQIRTGLATGDLLLTDTLDASTIIEETFSPEIEQPGKQLTLKMQVEYTARYISADDLNHLTSATLDAGRTAGFAASLEPVYEPVQQPVTDGQGVTSFTLKTTRTLYREIEFAEVFALIRGLRTEIAEDVLTEGLPLRKPAEIKLTPNWWPWMPLVPFNVSVVSK